MSVLHLKIPTPKGDVSAVWHPADGPALVVGHGAGAGMDHPFIVGFCEAVADEGIAALRFNFPYMEAGRRTRDAAKNAIGKVFQPGLQMRCDPQRHFILPFIRSGALGKSLMARSQWHKKLSWRADSPSEERKKIINWRLDKVTFTGLVGEIGIY